MRENKHTSYDLAQMQSLPLEAKIIMTKQRIRAWYEHWDGNVYVSVSGGKFDEQGMWIPHNGLGYKFVIDWLNEHGNLGIKY